MPSARAISSVSSGRGTPTICRRAPAGLVSGPSRLNAVRTPSSRRSAAGVPHRRVEGRREEEREAGLGEAARSATARAGASMSTPSASKHVGAAAVARHRAVAVLGDPHAARRRRTIAAAVEMLNVLAPSPPVPQVSNDVGPRLGSGTAARAHRRARSRRSRPAARLSCASADRAARRSAPAGASPSMIAPIACGGLGLGQVLLAAQLLEQRREHGITAPGNCAADAGPSASAPTRDGTARRASATSRWRSAITIVRRRRPGRRPRGPSGQPSSRHHQRVIAAGLERRGEAGEDAVPSCSTVDVLPCIGRGARDRRRRRTRPPSPDGPRHTPRSGTRRPKRSDRVDRHAGVLGPARARRDHDPRRAPALAISSSVDRVVAHDLDLGAQLAEYWARL